MRKLTYIALGLLAACGKAGTNQYPNVSGDYNISFKASILSCVSPKESGKLSTLGFVSKVRVSQKESALTLETISSDDQFRPTKIIDDTHYITMSGEYHGHKQAEGALVSTDKTIPAKVEQSIDGSFSGASFSGSETVKIDLNYNSDNPLRCTGTTQFTGEKIPTTV